MQESTLRLVLKGSINEFAPVVPFNSNSDRIIAMDFTGSNKDLTEEMLLDITKFTAYVNLKLSENKARYGIGGYAEYRELYKRSHVFDGANEGEEPRRLHLGIDIWGKPYTPVMAPIEGIVHSFGNNDQPGDYGFTIILTHHIRNQVFHSLYGHLSANSIKNLEGGKRIEKGEIIGEFGIPLENGQWPPHLHFQLIEDLQGWTGDYPGVCKYSEKELYLENCPDPDLVLQLNQYITSEIKI